MLPELRKGDAIVGTPYVVVESLGQGGMGSVYEVRDTLLEVNRAVKLIDVEVEQGPKRDQAIAEVLKEGRVIAKLHRECPDHIVEVLSMGITADRRATPYLVMEVVNGVTLSRLMQRKGGRLEAKLVRQVALQVLTALVTAHENGIVHRDLKPANIMVEPVPGSMDATRMKVIDFGITSEVGRRTVRRALTYKYGSPEQVHIEGKHPISAQTDLYALGVILFEAIAGRGPFDAVCRTPEQFIVAHMMHPAPSIGTMVPGLPPMLVRVIDSMLEKDPDKRPASARVCGEMLSTFAWNFSTSIDDDSQKTEETPQTAVASAVRALEEKRQRDRERAEKNTVGPVRAPPVAAVPPGVSATLPSPGVDPLARPQRAPIPVAQVDVRPTAIIPNVSTQSSPVVPAVRYNGGNAALPIRAGGASMAPLAARNFHVNETAPLPPELDTRGREPSTFRAVLQTIVGARGKVPQVRVISVLLAVASVVALLVVEVVVWNRHHAAAVPTPSPSAVVSAVVTAPSSTTLASAAPLTPVSSSTVAVVATVEPPPPSPTPRADVTASTAISPSSSSSRPAPVATTAKARPSASAPDPASSDIMIDLGDGTKIPMHTTRKLPGSGL